MCQARLPRACREVSARTVPGSKQRWAPASGPGLRQLPQAAPENLYRLTGSTRPRWTRPANGLQPTRVGARCDGHHRRRRSHRVREPQSDALFGYQRSELIGRVLETLIIMHDGGKGIAAPFLGHVFDRFRQEDSTSTRAHGGLGLGLAIVRSIAEAHRGTVDAASPGPGRGATFTIALPHTIGKTRERRGPMREAALVSRLHNVPILVVDDTNDERELFAEILQSFGAVVTTASSVAMAMALLPRIRPQVIVSDIAMPEEDGYELLRRVRAHADAGLAATPAVAVTAHARAEDRRLALAEGFDRYLSKPVYPIELAETVAAALSHDEW
jgi:CheY-like chemotaxis protein